jgi:Transposase DDE domain group 1
MTNWALPGCGRRRAHARGRAWRAGAGVDGLLCIDVDGTLVTAHSDKQGAAGTYKGRFGFYPLVCFLDRGDGTGEALSGTLRPGNAGSNTAGDHVEVVDLALAQLPSATHDQPIVVRADTGGATHAFTDHLGRRGVRFSISLPADERVRAAMLAAPEAAWQPAVGPDGQPRPGAEVAELAGLDLPATGWPQGTRAICRREDPHPGAQLSFSDADGHRFQAFITDQPDPDIVVLELRHRQRARIEDRIRSGKATGLRNLPFDLLRRNAVWLELVLMACDLTCWAQAGLWTASCAWPSPRRCTIGCGMWPPAWSATPAASSCACSARSARRPGRGAARHQYRPSGSHRPYRVIVTGGSQVLQAVCKDSLCVVRSSACRSGRAGSGCSM